MMAAAIPLGPVSPTSLRTKVAISRVAIAIPETGLFEDPTRPTILDDTVAKKNPNITMSIALTKSIGIAGYPTSTTTATISITMIGAKPRSLDVLSIVMPSTPDLRLFMLSANVLKISGRDLISEKIPPAATAPAPTYLI